MGDSRGKSPLGAGTRSPLPHVAKTGGAAPRHLSASDAPHISPFSIKPNFFPSFSAALYSTTTCYSCSHLVRSSTGTDPRPSSVAPSRFRARSVEPALTSQTPPDVPPVHHSRPSGMSLLTRTGDRHSTLPSPSRPRSSEGQAVVQPAPLAQPRCFLHRDGPLAVLGWRSRWISQRVRDAAPPQLGRRHWSSSLASCWRCVFTFHT